MNKNKILLGACCLLSTSLYAKEHPNILLFLVDDMGWGDTSVPFGNDTTDINRIYHTPNMERLANKGVKFTNAYASPISSPSRVSLFTGANAARHKVTNWTLKKDTSTDSKSNIFDFGEWNYNGMCPEKGVNNTFYAKGLPQVLRENGYTTMMVGKAHFGALDTPAENPLNIGFDYNIAVHAAGAMGSYLGEENYGNRDESENSKIWGVPNLEKYFGTETFLTEALTLEAKGLIDKALQIDKPFFLYMSHYAVHAPFGTDKRYYDKYIKQGLSHKEAQYAGLVEGMDKSLGDLMDYLEEKGIDENTIIIFMSDNGGYVNNRANMNAPLSEGKGSLIEGGIREPLIVSWNNNSKPNSVCDKQVIVEDFFPTILNMAGIKNYSVPQKVDGISFVSALKGVPYKNDRSLIFHYPNNWGERDGDIGAPQSAIIKGDWKLIYYYETQKAMLYNIKDDISEKNNLSNEASCSQIFKGLKNELTGKLRSVNATFPIYKSKENQADISELPLRK